MRRNFISLFLTITVAVITSCNGSFGVIVPDFNEYDGLSVQNIELKAVHNFNSGTLPAFKTTIDDFNNENEYGIKVELIADDNENTVDLVFCSPADAAAALRSGKIIELSPLAEHPQWGLEAGRRILYPAARKQTDYFDFARKITSLPILMNAGVVLVNSERLYNAGFDHFPTTWFGMDLFLKRAAETDKPVLGLQLNTETAVSFVMNRGGSVLRPVGFAFSLNNPVVNRTLRYLRNLQRKGVLSFNRTNYLNQTMFAFGNLAAVFVQTDGIPHYAELTAMTSPELNWEIALLPTRRPGDGSVINCTHSASISDGLPEKELASWIFINWLLDLDRQVELAEKTHSLPTVIQAGDAILTQNTEGFNTQWTAALQLIHDGNIKHLPSLRDYHVVSAGFQTMLENILEGSWVWVETVKLDWYAKKLRREEYKDRKSIR